MIENYFLSNLRTEIQQLWLGTSLFLTIGVLLSKTDIFNRALSEKKFSLKNKLVLIGIFSVVGILGTYWGIKVEEGIINTRAVGVIVGGLMGGPFVGFASGSIVGIHRVFFMDTFTSVESGLITVLQGVCAGLLSFWLKEKDKMFLYTLGIGFIFEIVHMIFLLMFARPYASAVNLVTMIAPSMLLTNSIGICLFVGIIEDNYRREERNKSEAARAAFKVMRMVISVLQEGYAPRTLKNIVSIAAEAVNRVSWAGILSKGKIVALSCSESAKHEDIKREIDNSGHFPKKVGETDFVGESGIYAFPIESVDGGRDFVLVKKEAGEKFSGFEKELFKGLSSLMNIQVEINRLRDRAVLFSEAEVKLLQTQINPHFLFNVLNTISYYCSKQPNKAKDLILYLAEYYRHSFSNEGIFISFRKEINHIRAFLNIEMMRFGNRLKVAYDIDRDLEINIPCLILQPLVENAVKHGVLPKENGGVIKIGVVKRGKAIRFYVYDNGVGMSEELRKNLLAEKSDCETDNVLHPEHRKSIGFVNVHRRLVAYYGKESGLKILSKENKGTIVYFDIPAEEITDDKNKSCSSR